MSPPKRSFHPDPLEWLNHARSDLRLAELAVGRDVLPEQLCFHAQQACEKALKAVLLRRRVEFPFTHDLAELVETAEAAGLAIPPEVARADELTPFAVETRYPGLWGRLRSKTSPRP
ncbi:MAG: HEPN domain-containing protein [Deferrisomatales bacterium]